MRHKRIAFFTLAIILFAPHLAKADETYAELNKRGLAAFKAGDYRQAADAWSKALDINDPKADKSELLNHLALVNKKLQHYDEAEGYYKRAIDLLERDSSASPRRLAIVMDNLGNLYEELQKPAESERMHRRALPLFKEAGGPNDPDTLLCQGNIAQCLSEQGKYEQALELFRQVIAAQEKAGESADLATFVDNLASLYIQTGKIDEALAQRKRALAIYERTLGKDHPEIGICAMNIAGTYYRAGKAAEGEPYMKRALQIAEKVYGLDHPALVPILKSYAVILDKLDRTEEADAMKGRADQIAAKKK